MNSISEPIIKKIKDNDIGLKSLADSITNKKEKEYILNYPILYIHNWKTKNKKMYEVYVGEANDVIQRTKQHYNKMDDGSYWSSKIKNNDDAYLYVIGHEHFNKSMTLSLENRMMHYLTSVESIDKVCNKRGNDQGLYYPYEECDEIFSKIWKKLHKENADLFPNENIIKDSVIFKASPFHRLTQDQLDAKRIILNRVYEVLNDASKEYQLILVEGGAGTGKTVLTNSIFYDLVVGKEDDEEECYGAKNIRVALVVNHDEQVSTYKTISKKLGIDEGLVFKATEFINECNKGNKFDVVFVDEAHLLYTQNNQSYQGNNQLRDIVKNSKVTVIMFDPRQVVRRDEYITKEEIETLRRESISQDNYINLTYQLRMNYNEYIKEWLNNFIEKETLTMLPDEKDIGHYELKIFDSIKEMDDAICAKAANENTKLSRLIASYDWDYNAYKQNPDSQFWEVKINDEKADDGIWHKPWNREISKYNKASITQKIKDLSWAEQKHTINEVGSTYTIQGFDLNYAGVILGLSIKFRNGKIIFDKSETKNDKVFKDRTILTKDKNEIKVDVSKELLKNEMNILLTRGVNGLYIYACDKELRDALKFASKQNVEKLVNKFSLIDNIIVNK